jgi:chemotaxis protein CheD
MANHITIGLGEIKVSNDPLDVLVAFGLGSCVGVGMFDPIRHLGGMLHAVLPGHLNGSELISPKFVDSGVQLLLEEMMNAGAIQSRLIVKMAGGANMLTAPGLSKTFDIGTRNIAAARETLAKLNLHLKGEEVGGQVGRTVRLYISDGRMTIRQMGNQEREV